MTEFRFNKGDGGDKQLKGLVDKGILDFRCIDCHKHLLVLQLTDIEGNNETEILSRVVVQCCECGGFSPVLSVSGQFHPGAPNDYMAFDILDDDIDTPEADVFFKAWSK